MTVDDIRNAFAELNVIVKGLPNMHHEARQLLVEAIAERRHAEIEKLLRGHRKGGKS